MNSLRAGWAAPAIVIAGWAALAACVQRVGAAATAPASWSAQPASTWSSAAKLGEASDTSAEDGAVDREAPSRWQIWSAWNALQGDAYELDSVDRFIAGGQHISCDARALVRYSGTSLRYQSPVQVSPAFRERLMRFEQVVSDVAIEVYGRAPRRVNHVGAYNCRPSRNRSYRVSEHALGNAIDVIGFDFAPATKRQPLAVGLPPQLRNSFQVRVARHWNEESGRIAASQRRAAAFHHRFLRELSERLSERSDVFRVMIGPSRPDHSDHFHFDMSPWRYVYF